MQQRQITDAAVSRLQELTGRTAIVTGSTSGIGLGIAQAFAASGMHVMLNGFGDEKEIRKIRADMEEAHGIKTAYSTADMSKPDDVVRMVEDTRSLLGKVDVLVNNAGIQHVEAIETFPAAKWDAIIAVDLSSAFHTIRAVVAEMKSRKWGRIINVASAHGLVASPYKAAYVAAKHGLLGLTKTVALETAEHGITVNAICPGYVLTPLVQKQIPETARARGITEEQVVKDVLLQAQPTRQFVTTEQIGALSVFLSSDAAASITGAALPVEGGWTAQ
jgi:3-hydroxybutyrate dehydrogenase